MVLFGKVYGWNLRAFSIGTSFKLEHPENASSPMKVTETGIMAEESVW